MRAARHRLALWLLGLGLPLIVATALAVGGLIVMGAVSVVSGAMGAEAEAEAASYAGAGGTTCAIDPGAIAVLNVNGYSRGIVAGGSDDQLYNAAVIIAVGAGKGLSQRDQQIALMTAMQESGLRNLDYGDRDSLGLFQQRPSMGWGTPEQVTDPYYAAGKFYDTMVAMVPDRDTMSLNDVAQAVQRSGFPDAYAKHEADALAVLQAVYADTTATMCAAVGNGMTLEQATAFMDVYRNADPAEWDINSCGCAGGCLVNCVSVSIYFVNRYTTSHVTGATGNGRDVAANMASLYGLADGGHVPRPYAIFSKTTGVTLCDGVPCGHTGVVLGIDEAADQIIIGEAGCGDPGFTGAHVYSLAAWSTEAYTYAYTNTILEGDPSADF
jgi:hypothetical protein